MTHETPTRRIPSGEDTFANPFLVCTACQVRVTHVTSPPLTNQPCGHVASTRDLCPSWGPVDGCTCASVGIQHEQPAEVSR